MRRLPLVLGLTLLAACSKGAQPDAPVSSAVASAQASGVPSASPSPLASARKVEEENDLYDFSYSYPAAAAVLGPLRDWLDADLGKKKAELIKSAKDGRDEAKTGGFEYRAYADGTEWKVVTDLPGWLSLSADLYSDSGGAHPNHGYDALVFDKQAGKKLDPRDLFTSRAALSRAIKAKFCDMLDIERAKRRGEKVDRHSGDEFDACIDPVDSTIILGSTNRGAFDRIGVLVGPYEAGPYAEGDYEFTLPVTPEVLAAVKPEYRSTFVVKR